MPLSQRLSQGKEATEAAFSAFARSGQFLLDDTAETLLQVLQAAILRASKLRRNLRSEGFSPNFPSSA